LAGRSYLSTNADIYAQLDLASTLNTGEVVPSLLKQAINQKKACEKARQFPLTCI